MKITRNGVDIELTAEEMRKVYWEQRDEYSADDIRSRYNVPDDKIDEAVVKFNRSIDSNDNFWEDYWLTVEYVCEDMGFEEREDY